MLVIADTSPLNYLVLIDAVDCLPRLYPGVVLPRGAWQELQHPDAPQVVVKWARSLPNWIAVRDAPQSIDPELPTLGEGEKQAIALAEFYRSETAVLLLLDEVDARRRAAARQLATTGTLGVLKAAAAMGWVDLSDASDRLRRTNFRVASALLDDLLAKRSRKEEARRETIVLTSGRHPGSCGYSC